MNKHFVRQRSLLNAPAIRLVFTILIMMTMIAWTSSTSIEAQASLGSQSPAEAQALPQSDSIPDTQHEPHMEDAFEVQEDPEIEETPKVPASRDMQWIEVWRHETIEPVIDTAIGDPMGTGVPHVAALIGHSVYVYELADDGPKFVDVLRSVPERPTAVAMAPHVPEAPASIWIGTEAPGLVYIFSMDERSGSFHQVERIRFSWGDIKQILPLDLDGQGMIDVAVLTDRDEALLFRWTPEGYVDVLSGELGRNVSFIDKGAISDSGRDDLVVARDNEQLVLLSWESDQNVFDGMIADPGGPAQQRSDGHLAVAWENYVWGTPISLMVDYFSGLSDPDISVISSRRLVHLYSRLGGGQLMPRTNPMEWPARRSTFVSSGRFTASERAVIALSDGAELTFWELFPTVNARMTITTPINPIVKILGGVNEGFLLIIGPSGFSLYQWLPSDYVRVFKNGQRFELKDRPLFIDGIAYFSAEDWSTMTGVSLRYDRNSGRISGSRGLRFLFGRINEKDWSMNGLHRQTMAPAVEVEGDLYLDAGFGNVIGVYTVWEPFSRTMLIDL